MNPSYKSTVNDYIASSFKARIADLQRNIDKIKCAQANEELEYKRMISEDLTVVSKNSDELFADRCISFVTKLRKLNEELKDVNTAYCNWKTIADYSSDM